MIRDVILFYDSDCLLCESFIIDVIKRDRKKRFYFCSLNTQYAKQALLRHGIEINQQSLDTMYVFKSEELFEKSDAVLEILLLLEVFPKFLIKTLKMIPRSMRNILYDFVSKNRKRIKPANSCEMMRSEWQSHFITDDVANE